MGGVGRAGRPPLGRRMRAPSSPCTRGLSSASVLPASVTAALLAMAAMFLYQTRLEWGRCTGPWAACALRGGCPRGGAGPGAHKAAARAQAGVLQPAHVCVHVSVHSGWEPSCILLTGGTLLREADVQAGFLNRARTATGSGPMGNRARALDFLSTSASEAV